MVAELALKILPLFGVNPLPESMLIYHQLDT